AESMGGKERRRDYGGVEERRRNPAGRRSAAPYSRRARSHRGEGPEEEARGAVSVWRRSAGRSGTAEISDRSEKRKGRGEGAPRGERRSTADPVRGLSRRRPEDANSARRAMDDLALRRSERR